MAKVEKPGGIKIDGNTYFVAGSGDDIVVTKAHGEGEKVVRNPETIKAVLEAKGGK